MIFKISEVYNVGIQIAFYHPFQGFIVEYKQTEKEKRNAE